jgi:hypothetical protein
VKTGQTDADLVGRFIPAPVGQPTADNSLRRSPLSAPAVQGARMVELVYTTLDVLVGVLIAWVAFYVIYRLLHEDR